MTDRARADTRLAWLIVGGSALATLVLVVLLIGWGARQATRWSAEQSRVAAAQRRERSEAIGRIGDDTSTDPVTMVEPPRPPDTVRPIGSPARWLDADDYPAGAQRRGEEGRVRVTLAVDRAGRPTGCSVALSSGSWSLDNGTCTAMMGKGRFEPAPDGPLVRRWTSPPVRWVLPK